MMSHDTRYTLERDGQRYGPYTLPELRDYHAQGYVIDADRVSADGRSEWLSVGSILASPIAAVRGPANEVFHQVAETTCRRCGHRNRGEVRFCSQCGTPVPAVAGGALRELAEVSFTFAGRGRDLLTTEGAKFLLLAVSIVGIPWAILSAIRWLLRSLASSAGTSARFVGGVGPIWALMGSSLVVSLLQRVDFSRFDWATNSPALLFFVALIWFLGTYALSSFVGLKFLRWQFDNTRLSSGAALQFRGDFIRWFGWQLLTVISVVTIIGWAWAFAAQWRWTCRNSWSGGFHGEFRGSGAQILWRSLVMVLGAIGVVTYPMSLCWFMRWFASQVVGVPAARPQAGAALGR